VIYLLCSVCKKNTAVIFLKEKEKTTALCLECAKKKGIDPMKAMMDQFKSVDNFDLENLTSQFDKFMADLDPEKLEQLGSNPFASLEYNSPEDNVENIENNESKNKTKQNKKTKTLDIYGINLTEKARNNELDIVIGRDKELERIVQILNRRSKNNPALIGEPGVGKTALVNALAIAIAKGKVPAKLIQKEVYLLDMTSLIAGTQFRGQFESRVKSIIEECKNHGNVILAIDEVHNIVGGQDHDNSMNAANMLKPALANGYVQLIGATTLKEYRKYIEKDTALERRFQTVIIDEPNFEDTVNILKGIRKYYEDYHKVVIPDETLSKAVELSIKYIHDRFLPDKAIDLIDEAASRVNLDDNLLAQATKLSFEIAALEEALKVLEDNTQINPDIENEEKQYTNYEKAAILKEQICKSKTKLDALNDKVKPKEVTHDHLAGVVELWTKIPVTKIKTSDKVKLLHLESNLKKKIIGQDHAVESISNAIIRKRAGLQNIIKPPSFIFVGPTGVGKTALVKALAYELFDSEDAVIKLDMSEYSESHSTSKLIGSPPGYVGYDEAGQLTEKVRRNPYSIILFDEIEKAHSNIYNVLLQILDDGKLTDSQGKAVSFKHTVIIMTSNLGTNFKNDGFGFSNKEIENDMLKNKIDSSLKNFFSPEFLNRIDEIVSFNKLSKETINKITEIMINEFLTETAKKGYKFSVTPNLINYISTTGYDPKFGARPLRRAIQKTIEDIVAVKCLKDEIKTNKNYTIDIQENKIVII
jgi:ATP-dependent Clp protease ATP-binding subunit ClpE